MKAAMILCQFFILAQSDEEKDRLYVFPLLYQMGITQTVTAATPWMCLAYPPVQKQPEEDQFKGVCMLSWLQLTNMPAR